MRNVLRMGDIFRALADPTRRIILDELSIRDGQTLFEICGRLLSNHGLSPSRQSTSQHLEVLESAGLIATRRDGRYKFHYINTAPLREINERWPGKSAADGGAGLDGGTNTQDKKD